MGKKLKIGVVIVGSIVLSTIAIQASDVLRGIEGSLTGRVIDSAFGPCGEHAVMLQLGSHAICVDTYEASPAATCPVADPGNEIQSQDNYQTGSCSVVSVPNVTPWRFVSLNQAQQLCARAGKRLPNNEEWYKAVSGMTDMESCAVNTRQTAPRETGTSDCVTPSGIHDMVGNVWEWVEGEVAEGSYQDRAMPESGYVALVDSNGVVVETSDQPEPEFGADYAWTNMQGLRGMIRGGFYSSGEDAGIYTLNAAVPLDFKVTGVGFRCVKDI